MSRCVSTSECAAVAAPVRANRGARQGLRLPALLAALLIATGCFEERERPGGITDPDGAAALTASVIAPGSGSVVGAGESIPVVIEARDANMLYLEGVGYVVRRIGQSGGTIDSVGIRFALRSDTTHEFSLHVPDMPTNTQLDIHGIAYGHGGVARLSEPVHVTVAQLDPGAGAGVAWSLH